MSDCSIPTIRLEELDRLLRRAKDERWESLTLTGPHVHDWVESEPGSDSARAFRLDGELHAVPPAILELSHLQALALPGQALGSAGAQAIAERLTGLTTLDLSGNKIGDAGALAIAEGLTGLTTLDLSLNNIGDAGALAIAEHLTGLTTLTLMSNNIGEVGARAITERLADALL